MFRVTVGQHVLQLFTGESDPPVGFSPAILTESVDAGFERGETVRLLVNRSNDSKPLLSLEVRNSPACPGFVPGVLLVPETEVLFLGTGLRVLIYDLKAPKRLLNDEVAVGFWGWEKHRNRVLMLSELELSAFDTDGARLWSEAVDVPWTYEVTGSTVVIRDCSGVHELDLEKGTRIGPGG